MKWFKIDPNHRPEKGHALLATFDPEKGGTLYYVTNVDQRGFTVRSDNHNDVNIPENQKRTVFIPYDLIPITKLHIRDRHRETNYE